MKGTDYNQAVWLFVVAFIICGLPSNLIYRWAGPKTLSVMMLLWGICSTCQGLVETPAGLKAMRFLMGMFEAGFIPSCAHLIGSYYSRDEFLKRYAVFFSSSVIAGAFNGVSLSLLEEATVLIIFGSSWLRCSRRWMVWATMKGGAGFF